MVKGCLTSTGLSNETEMKEDRDQTSCGPHDTDSYSVNHYHSDLNSVFTVCFSPEGSIRWGRDKQIAHWCRLCHMHISGSKLFLFLLLNFLHNQHLVTRHDIDFTSWYIPWFDYTTKEVRQFFPSLSVLAFLCRVPLRWHPIDMVSSLRRGSGC